MRFNCIYVSTILCTGLKKSFQSWTRPLLRSAESAQTEQDQKQHRVVWPSAHPSLTSHHVLFLRESSATTSAPPVRQARIPACALTSSHPERICLTATPPCFLHPAPAAVYQMTTPWLELRLGQPRPTATNAHFRFHHPLTKPVFTSVWAMMSFWRKGSLPQKAQLVTHLAVSIKGNSTSKPTRVYDWTNLSCTFYCSKRKPLSDNGDDNIYKTFRGISQLLCISFLSLYFSVIMTAVIVL